MKRILLVSALAGAAALVGLVVPTSATAATTTCNTTLTGTVVGSVTVPSGGVCQLVDVTVIGTVTVNNNGQLFEDNAAIHGNLIIKGGSINAYDTDSVSGNATLTFTHYPSSPIPAPSNYFCGQTVGGNLKIVNSTADVAVVNGCQNDSATAVGGNVQFSKNSGRVDADSLLSNGTLYVSGNTGGGSVADSTFAGYSCSSNSPKYVFTNDTFGGVLVASHNC